METKHTPGPWQVKYDEQTGRPSGIYAPDDAGIPGAVGHIVRLRGLGLPSSEKAQANARLIAAAPDLLEALIVAKATIDELNAMCRATTYPKVFDQINAAIAKATGGE